MLLLATPGVYAIGSDKHVLVLHSYHKGLSWTEKIISGIESEFAKIKADSMKVTIDYEYMDTKRFIDEAYMNLLYGLYKRKSKKLKYDVIISVDDPALVFLKKHRNDIFGEVPVVFCGVNFFDENTIKGYRLYTGVVEAFDVKATLNLALSLHPETREFVVVGDNTITSEKNVQAVRAFESFYREKNIQFRFFNSGDLVQYARDLGNLSKGSVVIAMLFNLDKDGVFYNYEDSYKIYTKYTNVPVYTLWDFYLGYGAVGGMIISGVSQGEEAAKKAIKILEGQPVKNIPILKESPNRYMFDYNVLQHFNIRESKLPAESVIINKPHELADTFQRHKYLVLGIFAFILFLTGVIIVLSINILKRKRVENQLLRTNIAYNRFVPHEFLDNLEKKSILDVELGNNVKKDMTVIFLDIRNFTSLSEKMTPEENFKFINTFLRAIGPVIRKHNGFIDKYLGDGIMALFPDKAEHAVMAAIEMLNELVEFNIRNRAVKIPPISIGIGIHIGALMLGTIGEEERMEGTVISDAVNLASRLEGLTKIFGANIILSEQTLSCMGGKDANYLCRFLGKVSVKGKKEPVMIYEIMDGSDNAISEQKILTKKCFEGGLELYYAKDFRAALSKFQEALKLFPEDKAALLYGTNAEKFLNQAVPDDWDGVERLEMK